MRLTVVGCSGSLPGPTSPASSYLVEAEDDDGRTWRLVLDLGSGALGPLQRHTRLTDVDAILLSHLHPDHCMDLCGLYVALKYNPVGRAEHKIPVHAPAGAGDRMARAYGLPPDPGMSQEFEFLAWVEGEKLRIGPFSVTARRVVHPVEAYAMRLQGPGERGDPRVLVYTGDTDSCDAVEELSSRADLLLAEAAFQEGRDSERGVHLTGRRAGELAKTASVKRLVLTHLPPWNDPDVALDEARSAYPGPITVAEQDVVHTL